MSTVSYDPFSDEAMRDPHPLYKRMREEDPVYYIEKYNAWALTRFDDVWEVTRRQDEWVTFAHGATPGQLMLGEPIPHTFMTMDAPEHRYWRGLIRKDYSPEGVASQRARLRTMVRHVLNPLLELREFDAYHDLANPILCMNAGYNLGLPVQDALQWRPLIDDMMHREPGQVGMTSERNQQAAQQLFGYLHDYISTLSSGANQAIRHTAALMNGEYQGHRLSPEELTYYIYSLLVVGSETTPMTIAGTFYYLDEHPEQKQAVLDNPSLVGRAFLETARFDQPTNMLARRAKVDFVLRDKHIRAGDNLLFIYASANRDAEEFVDPDLFNIFRETSRDLTFGTGGHKCLGMHLATSIGTIVLEEVMGEIKDFEVDREAADRAYGEHLSGFTHVPLRLERVPNT